MAVYKESGSVLFWSLAIMTYRGILDPNFPIRPISVLACFEDVRRGGKGRPSFNVNTDLFLHYLSCYVEFKSPAKCGTWEKCLPAFRWLNVITERGKETQQALARKKDIVAGAVLLVTGWSLIKSLDEYIRNAIQNDINVKCGGTFSNGSSFHTGLINIEAGKT